MTRPALFLAALALAACATETSGYSGDVVVYGEAIPPPVPAPRDETEPAAPSPNHVWVPGHWSWNGAGYDWTAGRWDLPRAGATWAPAHWEVRGRHHIWVRGYWQ